MVACSSSNNKDCQKVSVIESLHQAHKARLKRFAARSAPQRETPAPSRILPAIAGIDLKARRIPSRYPPDRDYERAWAIVIMGLNDELPLRRPRMIEIQRATAHDFNVSVNELLSGQRLRKVVLPRHVAMYLAKELTLKSYAGIGRAFADRDHSSVVHAVKGIERRLDRDADLADRVARIRCELQGRHP